MKVKKDEELSDMFLATLAAHNPQKLQEILEKTKPGLLKESVWTKISRFLNQEREIKIVVWSGNKIYQIYTTRVRKPLFRKNDDITKPVQNIIRSALQDLESGKGHKLELVIKKEEIC